MKHLKRLSLPDIVDLGLGFDPPWCGNAYDDNPELEDQVDKEASSALETLTRAIETHLTSTPDSMLQTVALGWPGYYTTYEVGEDKLLREIKPNNK